MKRIWMIVSTLAIANLLAISGLLAWLHTSDRLGKDRIQAIRTMLAVTQTQEQQSKADAAAQAVQEQKKAAEEARQAIPPVTAAETIAAKQLEAEKHLQSVLRQQQELENLRSGLMRQLSDLEQRERKLAEDRAAFAAERKRIAEMEGTEQFKVARSALENQKPKDAKAVLNALLAGRQVDQVVAYLSKMDESKRSKVIAEFVKDDPVVAADLLERLRTRGVVPPTASSAQAVSSAATAPAASVSANEPGSSPTRTDP